VSQTAVEINQSTFQVAVHVNFCAKNCDKMQNRYQQMTKPSHQSRVSIRMYCIL